VIPNILKQTDDRIQNIISRYHVYDLIICKICINEKIGSSKSVDRDISTLLENSPVDPRQFTYSDIDLSNKEYP